MSTGVSNEVATAERLAEHKRIRRALIEVFEAAEENGKIWLTTQEISDALYGSKISIEAILTHLSVNNVDAFGGGIFVHDMVKMPYRYSLNIFEQNKERKD